MKLTMKQTNRFLYIAQGVGAIFAGVFLVAYFGGLPSTDTLNSEPTFIILQSILGAILIAFVLVAFILVIIAERKD